MKNWKHLARLVRFRWKHFFLLVIMITMGFTVVTQAFGLVTRAFFNALTGNISIYSSPWILCVLLFVFGVVRASQNFIIIPIEYNILFSISTLIRRNLFEHILDKPGAGAIPDSTGETISRFRGDVNELTNVFFTLPMQVGSILFAVCAFGRRA